jgi:hypothetical protein
MPEKLKAIKNKDFFDNKRDIEAKEAERIKTKIVKIDFFIIWPIFCDLMEF